MKKNLFWKVLFTSLLATICFGVFSVYAANQAIEKDPQLFTKIEKEFGIKVNNFNIIFSQIGGEDVLPHSSSWEYEIPAESIDIGMLSGDVEVISNEGDKVLVTAEGDTASDAQQILDVKVDKQKNIEIKEPFKKVRNLHLTISIPKSFTKEINIASMSGDIKLTGLVLERADLGTASGDIRGEGLSITKFGAASISGDVDVTMLAPGNYDLRSTSGDVRLSMPQSADAKIEVGSMSGTINNTHRSNPNGKYTIQIGTTSGDVKLE